MAGRLPLTVATSQIVAAATTNRPQAISRPDRGADHRTSTGLVANSNTARVSVISNAEKRAIRQGETEIVPRVSDLYALSASTAGKIEIEYSGEERKEEDVIDRLLSRAIVGTFDRYFRIHDLRSIVEHFESGWGVQVGDGVPAEEYLECVLVIPGLQFGVRTLGGVESPGFIAAASEFIFEGLHLNQRLNKEREGGRFTYRAA